MSSSKPAKATKGKNFDPVEDSCITQSWLEVATNAAVATDQIKETMWIKIKDIFDQRTPMPDCPREWKSLEYRWTDVIQPNINKWVNAHNTACKQQ